MSNYVQTTFFTPKDSLPPTNPAKTIFGAAYDVEFGNIASAISSKIDATSAVTGITGTANQISASSSIGNVTLSFPLNIVHPAPVSGVTVTINGTGSTSALQVLGTGVQLGSPTGGDQGAGSINASNGFFVNGVAVVAGAAAAGSLTGTTLAANVVSSSLTALGTLGSLTISGALTGSSIALGGTANEGAGTINATGIFLSGTSILSSISANSLTGTTLASGVVNSSLTSLGTLTSLAVTGAVTVGGINITPSATVLVKTADETRTSTTALTADNTLTATLAASATYKFECYLAFDGVASGMGFSQDFNYSGSYTTGIAGALGSIGGSAQSVTNSLLTTTPLQNSAIIGTSNPGDWLLYTGTIVTNTSGTFAVRYAQHASTASALTMRKGSRLTLQRIS